MNRKWSERNDETQTASIRMMTQERRRSPHRLTCNGRQGRR